MWRGSSRKQGGRRRGGTGEREKPEVLMRRLVDEVAREWGMTEAELLGGSRRREVVRARGEVSRRAVYENGVSLRWAARVLGISPQSILRGLRPGESDQQRK